MKKWRGQWVCKFAQYVKDQFEYFKTKLEKLDDHYKLTIFNLNVENRNIKVNFDRYQATFCFSFHHAHFEYEDGGIDQLIDYMQRFISGEYVAYEFLKDGMISTSGGIKSCRVDFSSAKTLLNTFDSDITEEKTKQHALLWSESLMKHIPYEDHKKNLVLSPTSKDIHLQLLKEQDFRVGVEDWEGRIDAYKQINWDGNEFRVIDISAEDLLKEGYPI